MNRAVSELSALEIRSTQIIFLGKELTTYSLQKTPSLKTSSICEFSPKTAQYSEVDFIETSKGSILCMSEMLMSP